MFGLRKRIKSLECALKASQEQVQNLEVALAAEKERYERLQTANKSQQINLETQATAQATALERLRKDLHESQNAANARMSVLLGMKRYLDQFFADPHEQESYKLDPNARPPGLSAALKKYKEVTKGVVEPGENDPNTGR